MTKVKTMNVILPILGIVMLFFTVIGYVSYSFYYGFDYYTSSGFQLLSFDGDALTEDWQGVVLGLISWYQLISALALLFTSIFMDKTDVNVLYHAKKTIIIIVINASLYLLEGIIGVSIGIPGTYTYALYPVLAITGSVGLYAKFIKEEAK